MEKIRLGKTDLMVSRSGFGALPIQRISLDESTRIIRKAYEGGINFFDTARGYSDSETKLGEALSEVRDNVIIATKSGASDRKTFEDHLSQSLCALKTDYIDLMQIHNPNEVPDPVRMDGVYQAILENRERGVIRHIGISNHKLQTARAAIHTGLFETLQFPLSSLSSDSEVRLLKECQELDIGIVAMKALSGGLITDVATTFAFLRQFDGLVPIWGIQYEHELDEFLSLEEKPPELDSRMWQQIQEDRSVLQGDFCRGCGYCMPCPEDIHISLAARLVLLLHRAPYERFLTEEWIEKIGRVDLCTECGQCRDRCPYELDTPKLLKKNLAGYREFVATHDKGASLRS